MNIPNHYTVDKGELSIETGVKIGEKRDKMGKRNKWIPKCMMAAVCLILMGALLALGFLSPNLKALSSGEKMPPLPQTSGGTNAPGPRDGFLLFDEATGKNLRVSAADYAFYATACEMPASYEEEALSAQAVAAVTYARYCTAHASDPDTPILRVNTASYRGYCTDAGLKKLWGEKEPEYRKKLKRAADRARGRMIVFDGQPILAAYFAVSAGKTEDCALVWGGAMPYLKPVEIGADLGAENFERVVRRSREEMKKRLTGFDPDIHLPGRPEEWFGQPVYSESRTVLSIPAGDRKLTGQQMRKIAGLASASFAVTYEDGVFLFRTHGSGHGVGLSQHGANELAKAGMTCDEILTYFYTGTEIREDLK